MFDILIGVLEQGLVFAIMALGVYITYRILDFPDLSVDGSFPLGAAISAILITGGMNPWLTLLVAFGGGILAGLFTGFIHVKLGVKDLLSGIITMTALYTINLRIAGGKSNLPIFDQETIFNSGIATMMPESVARFTTISIVFILAMIVKLALDWYLNTKSGFLLFAVGDNKHLVTSLAKDQGMVKIMGLALANGLVALSGAIVCQQQRFFDVTMGTGTIVVGLASVIIGMKLFKNMTFIKGTMAAIIGSIIYKGCIAIAIALGFQAMDMKLITALLFLAVLSINTRTKKGATKSA